MKEIFTQKLIEWHLKVNKRTMPWKGEKEPYKIWISEIILQQTRAAQAISYYDNFIKTFPTIGSLASSPDESVFKVWEGLGYYSRCKNIIFTARYIVSNLSGEFPDTYDRIIALKGIGPYTAAAISSFAFGLAHAVVDGNVFRVLARYFGEAVPIDSAQGKKHFTRLANELLFKTDPAAYNQAIMDFGATVCKPQIPVCSSCVLQTHCTAFDKGLVNKLPVKEKQLTKKSRWFTYFVFTIGNKILVNKRTGKDIWQNLFEFYLSETEKNYDDTQEEIAKLLQQQLDIKRYNIDAISPVFSQQLTHQILRGRFINVTLYELPDALRHFQQIQKEDLRQLAFPKFINQYFQNIQQALFD